MHERSLKLLATTGVKVMSDRGRKILKMPVRMGIQLGHHPVPAALMEDVKMPPASSSLAAAVTIGTWR